MRGIDKNEKIHILANGRVYKVKHTGEPYRNSEYPSGGYLITRQLDITRQWTFVDYSPCLASVADFLRIAAKLPELEEKKQLFV